MTRVSPRAKKALEQKLNDLQGVSQAAYVRQILYKHLGLTVDDKESDHG